MRKRCDRRNRISDALKWIEEGNINIRDAEGYIKELPLKLGQIKIEQEIKEWYREEEIGLATRELLKIVVTTFFKYNENLIEEIKRLRAEGSMLLHKR